MFFVAARNTVTVVATPPHRHDTDEAQLLFKEARRRRRRLRMLWLVIAAAVLGCAVGFGHAFHALSRSADGAASTGRHGQTSGHPQSGATLVYAFNDLRVIDADTGATRTMPMPTSYGSSRDLGMVRMGNSLLLNRGNTAWLYAHGVTGSPTDLGRSDGVFQGPDHNEAWIWSQPCRPSTGCANYNAPQMGSVQLVDSSGREIGSPVQLPGGAGWYPTGLAGEEGIVLSELPAYGQVEEVWNPLTDRVVRVFSDVSVIGIARQLVVWEPSPYCSGEFTACSVDVTNLEAGTNKAIRLPEGVTLDGDAAISPNGRVLALTASLSRAGRASYRAPYREVIVPIDLRSDKTSILAGSRQDISPSLGPTSLTWSTNGWLFADTVGSSSVRTWHPGEGRAWVLPRVRLPRVQLVNEDPSLIAL